MVRFVAKLVLSSLPVDAKTFVSENPRKTTVFPMINVVLTFNSMMRRRCRSQVRK